MSAGRIWVDGGLKPLDEPHLSARDRGFTLGDGLFETVRLLDRALLGWDAHLERLRSGARAVHLNLPWSDDSLLAAVRAVADANGLADGVVRIGVSRGVPATRGLPPDPEARPSLVVDVQGFAGYPPALYERGMRVITSTTVRNERALTAHVKASGYLEQVLARQEAAERGADEALLRNTRDRYACASAANLWIVSTNDELVTPSLAEGPLPGTVRALLLGDVAASVGAVAREGRLGRGDLRGTREVLVTNALLGVMPVTSIDGRSVGDGRPGRMATLLRGAVHEARLRSARRL